MKSSLILKNLLMLACCFACTLAFAQSDSTVKKPVPEQPIESEEEKTKYFEFPVSVGINLGNILEYNSPSGTDNKSFSASLAIDAGLNYIKEGSRFAMTNELHWTLALAKAGLDDEDHIQRATDELSTLHDFSFNVTKNNKWSANLIAKTSTSVFTIYGGDYFKDYDTLGRIQAFVNPYEVTISPGIKYTPFPALRISLSPYSMTLYGLTKQDIANTGFYTEETDDDGNYKLFIYKQRGAELNIWLDKKVKKWLEVQYRLGISSDYFDKLAKNGLMDGLFITKVKIIKNLYLTHRASLKADLAQKPFKPYYSQTIILAYTVSF